MAKVAGFPFTLTVDDGGGTGRDLSNDVGSVNWSTPRAQQNVTGLDKSAMERLMLIADFQITLNGFFNPSVNQIHETLKDVTSSTNQRTVALEDDSGDLTLSCECLFSDYAFTRSQDGAIAITATAMLANGTVPTYG